MDDELLRQAKELARQRGETLTSLIDQGLRLLLAHETPGRARRKRVNLPVSKARGGTLPGVDLDDSAGLESLMGEKS
ncbi:MAG TPA: DUF2191 domain-containing protein [Thermoanaerobaculia bacterium]|nr:DUF2191 domain-containing protein [Thermoanaerobaculia bacterium]